MWKITKGHKSMISKCYHEGVIGRQYFNIMFGYDMKLVSS